MLFRKDPSKCEVINDADGELVTFWRVIQNHLEEFLRYFKYAIISREIFNLEKDRPPRTLTDIQRAACYYYLQKQGSGAAPPAARSESRQHPRPGSTSPRWKTCSWRPTGGSSM